MTLTGKDADDFMAAITKADNEERARLLEEAKQEAEANNKERFDLERLETMCDTSREGRLDSYEVRCARLEEMYYVRNPKVRSLQEFARLIEELNRWS